jgi:branched-chain amino acid transport system substrate-binding protein
VGLVELSGTGATSGTNFDNGVKLAVKEMAKALAQKAVDESAYVVMGPVFSGSILVSMVETRRAEIPNFT